MGDADKWLVRLAALVILLWFGWQLAAQTAVTIMRQSAELAQLRQQTARSPAVPAQER